MSRAKNYYDGLTPYLTQPAKEVKAEFIEIGLDPDLAHTILELSCSDTEIYELDDSHETRCPFTP